MKICRHARALYLGASISVATSSAHAQTPPQGPVCGNDRIEVGEACDDANLLSGDGCSATCSIEEQCYDAGNVFSFFTWSDSYTSAGDGAVTDLFQEAVNRSAHPGRVIPRFWISTGDIPFMADGNARLDELNDVISNSSGGQYYPFACSASNGRFPYFVAIGNHDVDGYDTTTPASQYDYWSNYVGPTLWDTLVGIQNFREGPSNTVDRLTTYSFDYKNAHFVVVNQYHGDAAYPTASPTACMRQEMHDWIDQDLAQTDRQIKFVFGHEPAWSYCSNVSGFGGDFCPVGSLDNLNPAYRPRPHSTTGSWLEAYGRHWGDSLEDASCPAGSREAFWSMLAQHRVTAHLVGHTHTYGSRLVQGDGTRRNDVSPYAKTGQTFDISEGVWEVDSGQAHNSAGAAFVLTTVRDNLVTFEAYDQMTATEPFKLVERWSVRVGSPPSVALTWPIDGASFAEGAPVTLTADAADLDGSVNQVAFYAGTTLIGTATTAPFTISWSGATAGSYSLTAVAQDDAGLTATSASVGVTIYAATDNHPPVLGALANQTVDEQTALTLTASATDPDEGGVLTYSLIGAPTGASIDAVSGAFGWTPSEVQGPSSYTFTVRVRDNGSPALNDDKSLTVTVNELNRPPVIAPIATQTTSEGALLSFTASATDPDLPANTLAFTLVGAPAGASIGASSGVFSWTPNDAQGGANYSFSVRVSDSGNPALTAETPVSVTVNEVNQAPVLTPIGNKTTAEGTLLTFTASAVDPDLPPDALGFSLAGAPAGATIDPVSGVFTWTPTAAQVGPRTLTVIVTDNGAPPRSDSEGITVTVSGRADLTMTALSTTTTAIAPGSSFSASNTVKNQGAFAAGAFTIAFHLSADPVWGGADDVAFTQTRTRNSLGIGATHTASTSLTVPAATPLGAYYVCALADSGGTVAEGNETNNALCGAATLLITRSDLRMTQTEPAAASVNAGATLAVSNTVQNTGALSAGSFRVGFRLSLNDTWGDADDIAISTVRTVASLASGASSSATTAVAIPATAPAGSYRVCARADSASAITETDETNNTLCGAGSVSILLPDLTISAASTTAASITRGSTFTLSNTVLNQGGSQAGSFVIAFHLSVDPVWGGMDDIAFTATRSRNSLGAGASHTANTKLRVPATTASGPYYVCALADANGAIGEGDETNNASCTAGTIQVNP